MRPAKTMAGRVAGLIIGDEVMVEIWSRDRQFNQPRVTEATPDREEWTVR
jgi:hypothetical protein